MKGTTRRKNRQPTLPDDSGSNNDGKTTPVPSAVGLPEEWRLEAAIVSLLTLTDGDNRLISPPFRVLPTPTEFPLYYEHIKNPIDLKCIAERVRADKYVDWAALEADIQLLCQNAKDFSESGPMLRKDADLLLDQFKSRVNELTGARRFSARVLARNKEYIDELLRSTASEVDEYSEDSEDDEDSERSDEPAWRLYWTIRNFDVVDGVPLCENFMELPSKRSYPDYYEEIERPMSLYMINKKLKRDQYGDAAQQRLHGLVQDLLLMFDNACSYNIEESDIYEAAQRLRKLTLQTVRKLDNTFKTNTAHKAVKQELVDVADANDKDQPSNEHKQQHHSHPSPSPPILPQMNGNSAMPPPPKRRKVGPKSDGNGEDDAIAASSTTTTTTTVVAPLRRQVKREASAKGEQAIKRMVESDFEEDDDDLAIVALRRPTAAAASVHLHQNNLKNGGGICTVPSSSSPASSVAVLPVGEGAASATTTACTSNKSQHRALRRMNADGTPAERMKPGRKSVDELREKFAQKLTAVWQDVHSLKLGNRTLAEPFMYLPCDKTFPDYYRTITKPISMMCIQRKIKEQLYADSDELLADLRQMFANAHTFNKPDAQICADANILESVALGSMRTHTEGVTLFYPYRRTDKGWSEKASIERSPLKMKRKGVLSTAPLLSTSSNASAAAKPSPSSTTATATATTISSSSSSLSSSNVAVGDAKSATMAQPILPSSAVYIAPSSMGCPTVNAVASTSGAVYYAGPPPPPQTAPIATFVADNSAYTQLQQQTSHHSSSSTAIIAMSVPPNGPVVVNSGDAVFAACNGGGTQGAVTTLLNGALPNGCAVPLASTVGTKQLTPTAHKAIVVNGVTVMIPANAQTVILPPGYLGPQQTQQIILHTGAAPGVPSLAHQGQQQSVHPFNGAAASQQQQAHQLQQMLPSSSSAKQPQQSAAASFSLVNGMPPNGTNMQQMLHAQQLQHYHGGTVTAFSHDGTITHGQSAMPSTSIHLHQMPGTSGNHTQQQQMIIDPGRAVVNAMPRMALPVFVEPSTSVKIQRVLHSEAYVRYIESMYSNKVQRTVSKWDKNLQSTQQNTSAPPSSVFIDAINNSYNINGNTTNNRRQLAQHWIRLSANGSKRREEVLMKALWTLRDQLIEGTIGVARHAELPAGEPPTTATTLTMPSSSSKSDRNNNNNSNNTNNFNNGNRIAGGGAGRPSTSAATTEKRCG